MKNSVYIIAEAGVNHNGSLELAKKLVDAAVDANVDAIKFQTFKAESLVTKSAPKALYQKKATLNDDSQYKMLKKLELGLSEHKILKKYCEKKGVYFMSTPFDLESADLLINELGVNKIKISSGDITNAPLLLYVARLGIPVILSTGMSFFGDIENALGVLAFGYLKHKDKPSLEAFSSAYSSIKGMEILEKKVALLHCTTEYPAPFEEINLNCLKTLETAFGLQVGYSDHTEGVDISLAAVALGAKIIEKHFTLDKTLSGPDHKASLEPEELKNMVTGIRNIEKAMGSYLKKPTISELKNKSIVLKSIVAKKSILKGDLFTQDNLTFKRTSNKGISPFYYWSILGNVADKNYKKDEMIFIK